MSWLSIIKYVSHIITSSHFLIVFTSQLTSYTHNYSSPLSNYYVSGIHQRSYGLPIPNSFPAIFRGVDSEGFLQLSNSRSPTHYASVLFPSRNKLLEIDSIRETERQNGVLPHHCDSLVAMTGNLFLISRIMSSFYVGLGCDRSLLSPHLKTILSIWRERGNITTSELSRLGISQGDCHEIDENLANLVARYSDEE